jgi:hypothetical protein
MPEEELHELDEPVIEKLSLADRIARDKAARLRRRERKQALEIHSYKEEKDARERLAAKRLLEKQKKKARKKLV